MLRYIKRKRVAEIMYVPLIRSPYFYLQVRLSQSNKMSKNFPWTDQPSPLVLAKNEIATITFACPSALT
jgi:hypothetical protein